MEPKAGEQNPATTEDLSPLICVVALCGFLLGHCGRWMADDLGCWDSGLD